MIGRHGEQDSKHKPAWTLTTVATMHGGTGCTLRDIGAEWLVFGLGLTIADKALFADFPLDFAFAWLLGVGFPYSTIVPIRRMGQLRGIWAAVKADTFSIVTFQLGLFVGMYLYQQVIFAPGLPKTCAGVPLEWRPRTRPARRSLSLR